MDHTKPNVELYNVPWTTEEFNEMPYRMLGGSGLRVSNVGLGTWKFGYPETGDGSRVDEKAALAIFDRAVELGITFWDTANRYNNASGNSERIIGLWLKENPDQRRNIILGTKVFGGMDGRTPNHSQLSRLNIIESVHACIERMQIDYIDLLYFHAFDPIAPVEESLSAVEDLIQRGLVHYFAVSNFNIEQLALYRVTEKVLSNRCRVLAVQNHFDILNREVGPEKGVLDYAAQIGISYIAWSPLALGLLTERYLDLSKVGSGDRLYDEGVLEEATKENVMEKVHKLADFAHELGLELNQLALAYMLTLPGMGPVIPSSSSVEQLESNAKAGKVVLSEEQLFQVKEILLDTSEDLP